MVATRTYCTTVNRSPEYRPPCFVRGEGVWLYTAEEAKYLDAVSGTFNCALGYQHPRVVHAINAQINTLYHVASNFAGADTARVIQELLRHAPKGICRGWLRDLCGSTANTCAIKMAQVATGRTQVVSLHDSHHGQTAYMTGCSGCYPPSGGIPASQHGQAVVVRPSTIRRPNTGDEEFQLDIDDVRRAICSCTKGVPACIIVEPVQGHGGNWVLPRRFCQELRSLADEFDCVLIADEVQTCFGRIGSVFGSNALGLEPDIVTLGKGLGGGFPAAAVLMKADLDVLAHDQHSFTCGGNLPMLAAISATLDVIQAPGFLEGVRQRGEILQSLLQGLKNRHACIGDVRGLGFMYGLAIIDANGRADVTRANAIKRAALKNHRLILRLSKYDRGNVVKVRPALVATESELNDIVSRISASIHDTHWE